MAQRIQFRRDTKANWQSNNPILLEGEIGYVTDDKYLYKMGDGTHHWNDLAWQGFNGNVVQEGGTSEDAVMSQKAVSEYVSVSQNITTGKIELLIGDTPALIVDNEPEEGSDNLVKSGGVRGYYGGYKQLSEWIYAVCDKLGRILFGVNPNGEFYANIPDLENLMNIQGKFSIINNEEYLFAITDSQGRILLGLDNKGQLLCDGRGLLNTYPLFPIEIADYGGQRKWIVIGYNQNGARKDHCIAIGNALLSNNKGIKNIAIGEDSMQECEGSDNTAVGYHASFRNKAGQNSAFGSESQDDNTTGEHNTSVGFCSLQRNNIGDSNVAIGYFALQGKYDIPFDPESLKEMNRNIAIGARALVNLLTGGNDNIAIGYQALPTAKVYTNNIAIGNNVDCTKDNQTVIGNDDTEETIIRGDLIVKGADGVARQIVFNNDGTCSWTLIQ